MDLRGYLRVFRRRIRLMALVLLACVGLAVVNTALSPNVYTSTSTLFVSAQDSSGVGTLQNNLSGALLVQQRVKSYADILQSPELATQVASDLGVAPSEVLGTISASVPLDTVLIKVSASSRDPKLAQRIVNAADRRFSATVADIERPDDGSPAPIKISVTQPALLPAAPTSPKPATNLALGVFLGLALAVAAAVARESLDTRVHGSEQVEGLLEAPVLGAIAFDPTAKKDPLIVHVAPSSPRAEAFRTLRTNLQFVDVGHELRSMVVTSAIESEGKSTTSCNIAISLAQAGTRVVLVEGDLRRPRVADYMGVENAVGLTDALLGTAALEDLLQPWGEGALMVLASGPLPPNPSELLGSAQMEQLLRRLEGMVDLVVIDAPPVLPVTDAAVLGAMTGGVLMVVGVDRTRREQVKRAGEAVRQVGAVLLGAVINKVPRRGADSGTYGYGYGYGYAPDGKRPAVPAAAVTGTAAERSPEPPPLQLRRRG